MNYEDKQADYYSNIRHDLIGLIGKQERNLKVLEIGAAYGATLEFLKNSGVAQETVGVDLFEDKEHQERYKKVDRFIFGNIEQIDLAEYEGYFDIILLPDVLEHLIEPKKALEKIKKYLKDNGSIYISIPNIRHYSAMMQIFFRGDFRYEESGILDYTHLRFFCRKNIFALVLNSGLQVKTMVSAIQIYKGRSVAKIFNTVTFGLFEEFLTVQYLVKASK
ncbi:class I SAM-dependent methyltransferase [Flavobacterium sp.]|uniref:class I SAM-dependent methyltransferase n=1 Tax=Flavobacterium sp. TaxID=239 RepID=UPI0028BD378A|nr:class I SAM-dependent methyltransferase [Flavobacterium sp.]